MAFPFIQISNDYCQKSFREFLIISTMSQIFLIYTFLTMKFIYLFEICPDIYFVSLFFLNERNITTSFLTTQLKCTVVHYANLNSSFKNKPFINYVPLNMLFFKIYPNRGHIFKNKLGNTWVALLKASTASLLRVYKFSK